MLIDTNNTRLEILSKLCNSQFVFHITGSRKSGYNAINSDYDYFAVYSDELHDLLTSLGFRTRFSAKDDIVGGLGTDLAAYSDQSVQKIYRHDCGIDVQTIKPDWFRCKIIVNELLLIHKVDPKVFTCAKVNRKEIWGKWFNIVKQIQSIEN